MALFARFKAFLTDGFGVSPARYSRHEDELNAVLSAGAAYTIQVTDVARCARTCGLCTEQATGTGWFDVTIHVPSSPSVVGGLAVVLPCGCPLHAYNVELGPEHLTEMILRL